MNRARIVGTGMAVPDKILTNADLERMVDTTDEWIVSRTGIRERHIATADEALSDFAVPAAERALEMAGIPGGEVDLVICATVSPDTPFPATSTQIQAAIGADGAAAFDISAACTGFIYGLGIANQYLRAGGARTALVVGGEILSKFTDWTDRNTCVLFGDGAGAAVLRAENGGNGDRGILGVSLHSDGDLGYLLQRPAGGSRKPPSLRDLEADQSFIKMRGNETFKIAVRSLAEVSDEVLKDAGIDHEQVDWFIPHQANLRIIEAVGRRLEIRDGHTYVNIERFGNTSAASVPIALDELNRAGKIAEGDVVLCAAFGSGLVWGAGLFRW
ncbi:MAG: beta-ketoacyl-ACP synthase III [Thermoanaerobaculia bacterium]